MAQTANRPSSRPLPPTAATLTKEERSLRSSGAGLGRHPDDPRAIAAKAEWKRMRQEQKEEAKRWLETQIAEDRLRPLNEDQLVRIAAILRVAEKAGS